METVSSSAQPSCVSVHNILLTGTSFVRTLTGHSCPLYHSTGNLPYWRCSYHEYDEGQWASHVLRPLCHTVGRYRKFRPRINKGLTAAEKMVLTLSNLETLGLRCMAASAKTGSSYNFQIFEHRTARVSASCPSWAHCAYSTKKMPSEPSPKSAHK